MLDIKYLVNIECQQNEIVSGLLEEIPREIKTHTKNRVLEWQA